MPIRHTISDKTQETYDKFNEDLVSIIEKDKPYFLTSI